jgi:putative membrane protein
VIPVVIVIPFCYNFSMFKALLRNMILYSVSLYALPFIIPGVIIHGGLQTIIIGGLALTIMFLILKPIFSVLTFPLNLITLGFFSTVTNAVILYLLTIFIPNVIITAFTTPRTSIAGFITPTIHFNTIFAFLTTAVVLSAISGVIRWIIK